jgi:hypothetical protein
MVESQGLVTIVNGATENERIAVPIVRLDDAWVFVRVGEVERRFSRKTGFEHPPGGSWSAWRLAGADRRRLKARET